MANDDRIFYVYTYTNTETNTVFYVGKGKNNRDTSHLRDVLNNREPNSKIRKEKFYYIKEMVNNGNIPEIKRVSINLTEKEAFIEEDRLISFYGFSIDGGTLLNKKRRGRLASDLKSDVSKTLKKYFETNDNPRLGVLTPPEVRKKQSEARKRFLANGGTVWNKGIPATLELRERLIQQAKDYNANNRQPNAKFWITPEGYFKNKKEASEATGLTVGQIKVRCQKNSDVIPKHEKTLKWISERYGEDKIGLTWKEIGFYNSDTQPT